MSFEIIIPFYNESHRFEAMLVGLADELKRSLPVKEGVPIRFWWADDGSTDNSSDVLRKLLARQFGPDSAPLIKGVTHKVLRYDQNRGKGSIVRFAIEQMRGQIHPQSVVAFWDSDGELQPQGLFEAMQLVHKGIADIVFGSRFSKRNAQVLNFRHYLGNKLLTLVSNWFSNLNLSDVHCCARMMRAEVLFQIPLKSKGFDFEAEFAALVGRIKGPKLNLMEIPILYTPRTVDEGKKISFVHVWPQIYQAVRCRYFQPPIMLNYRPVIESRTEVIDAQTLRQ